MSVAILLIESQATYITLGELNSLANLGATSRMIIGV
jgi:hypothetical protein